MSAMSARPTTPPTTPPTMAPVFEELPLDDEDDDDPAVEVAVEVEEAVEAARATVVAKILATDVSLKPPSGALIVAPPEPLLGLSSQYLESLHKDEDKGWGELTLHRSRRTRPPGRYTRR